MGESPTRARARLRVRLRRIGFDPELLQLLVGHRHTGPTRKQKRARNQAAWPAWPHCAGTTKTGGRCRRLAIADRRTHEPIGPEPLCRWHGGLDALPRAVEQAADQASETLARAQLALERLHPNRGRDHVTQWHCT